MRRTLPTVLVVSMAALGLLVQPGVAGAGTFSYGVAAGEVTSESAILWAHADASGDVTAEVSTSMTFIPLAGGSPLPDTASATRDNTVRVTTTGLTANTTYFYRFKEVVGGGISDVGKFKTAPASTADATIRFAYTGDSDGTVDPGDVTAPDPFHGVFPVFAQMVLEGNDFNINLGDTIYSDSSVFGAPALTRAAKWVKYNEILDVSSVDNSVALREDTGQYSQWDDHEFINDFSVANNGSTLYNAGSDAFQDYAPVSVPDIAGAAPDSSTDTGLYRTRRWGQNLELFFLDQRSFRDKKASDGTTCDNGVGNSPDLAPTAPQDPVRNLFSLLIPGLATPIPQACLDLINDPDREFLGAAQLAQFKADIAASDAHFKVVVNEVPVQEFFALPYDRWEGYAAERLDLLEYLQTLDTENNIVWLTTDMHANVFNVVRLDTFKFGGPRDTGMFEMITGPVATNDFGTEVDAVSGIPGSADLVRALFFKPSPFASPPGVGQECSDLTTDSYAEVVVDANTLTITPKDEFGNLVQQVVDEGPPQVDGDCGPFTIDLDSDSDGFPDTVSVPTAFDSPSSEDFIGTDPFDECPDDLNDDAWPPDLNNDKHVSIGNDIIPEAVQFGMDRDPRFSMVGNDTDVSITDILKVAFNFGGPCDA